MKTIKVFDDKTVKVKVVRNTSSNWYGVGDVYEVESPSVRKWNEDRECVDMCYLIKDATYSWVRAEHCEVVEPTLQEQLQAAKDNVASLEAQLAAEAARPFTQDEYERVVAQYRACAGRKAFVAGDDNFVLSLLTTTGAHTQAWTTYISVAPFGVFFKSHDACKEAIKEVGEESLRKALEFEMSIGLEEAQCSQ